MSRGKEVRKLLDETYATFGGMEEKQTQTNAQDEGQGNAKRPFSQLTQLSGASPNPSLWQQNMPGTIASNPAFWGHPLMSFPQNPYFGLGAQFPSVSLNQNFQTSPAKRRHVGEKEEKPPPTRKGSSRYRGVCWLRQRKAWRARIEVNGKRLHLGYFESEEDAARAYDAMARECLGPAARLNFTSNDDDLKQNPPKSLPRPRPLSSSSSSSASGSADSDSPALNSDGTPAATTSPPANLLIGTAGMLSGEKKLSQSPANQKGLKDPRMQLSSSLPSPTSTQVDLSAHRPQNRNSAAEFAAIMSLLESQTTPMATGSLLNSTNLSKTTKEQHMESKLGTESSKRAENRE